MIAALSAVAAFAAPSAANAAVTPVVAGNVLTVTGDNEANTITLAAAGGVITVDGTPTTLPADANAQIVVNAAFGQDVVDASALGTSYGTLTVNGGESDDLITGGAKDDTLRGDQGDDRLVGFRGTDTLKGGEDDDVMVWNKADGNDHDDGEAGTDEVEVNGDVSADDAFTVQPDPTPGRARIDRTNLVPFGIDFTAERLTVNTQGGNDNVLATGAGLGALTAITVNAGSGNDAAAGGEGADQLNGGSGVDALQGGGGADTIRGGDDNDLVLGDAGDDRLFGDRNADQVSGGTGDDALVWNNGDGSDTNQGEAGFDRTEVNGSAAAGDVLKLRRPSATDPPAPFAPRAILERTNLVPFTVTMDGSTEAVAVTGGGGDDVFTVDPGLPALLVAADGGSGNDRLTGAEENDSFFGGSGNDTLAPGAGSDLADGDDGDDVVTARDGYGDLIRGGTGTDSAVTDAVTMDVTSGVERLDATPAPAAPKPAAPTRAVAPLEAGDAKALLPKLGRAKVVRSRGRLIARVPVSCPAAEKGGCRVTLTLETARTVRLGKLKAVLVLGTKTVRLRAGRRTTVAVRLPAGAQALAKRGKIAVRARIATADAAGNRASRSTGLSLRVPRR